jgi:hypothetical protein
MAQSVSNESGCVTTVSVPCAQVLPPSSEHTRIEIEALDSGSVLRSSVIRASIHTRDRLDRPMMVGGATFEALLSVNGNSHLTTALDIADCNDGRCDLPKADVPCLRCSVRRRKRGEWPLFIIMRDNPVLGALK